MADGDLDFTDQTVEELEGALDQNDYTLEELREMRAYESDSDDPRSTALDAIDDEINDMSSGPDVPGENDNHVPEDRYTDGAGATELGVVGVDLPDPYASDAPESLRIYVPTAMGIAGIMFDESGRHDIAYATPNDADVAGMRVKKDLEAGTNNARLAEADPHHPNHGDEG